MIREQLHQIVVKALDELKGFDIMTLDVRQKSSVTDIMVICSGHSARQVRALAGKVVEKVKAQGEQPIGVEGDGSSGWVLVDLNNVVVHVMLPEIREFYSLEKLWGDDSPQEETL